ncbi:MAG TPA: DUF929 family protein [Trebonia sp.]|nr:DUF929 family protein [Trebonia sp.]
MGTEAHARQRRGRDKIAAQRVAARRTRSRRRILIASGSIGLVAVLGIAIALVRPGAPRASSAAGQDPSAAREVTSVPPGTFDVVGPGTATAPTPASGQTLLTSAGKPEVLYMGGEYCPFCAAERWALTAALSRFGTFTGLSFIHSSPSDVYPGTPTLTFYKSGYTSRYVSFVPVEWYGEADDASTPTGHAVLQTPTAAQSATFAKYASNSFPFVDIGDKYITGVQYNPADLAGMSWSQVAAAMRNPSSTPARDIDGAANLITAGVCTLTHGQPGSVCSSAGVMSAARSLHAAR